MRKLILLMHVSLDGFVAGPNGEMEWIYMDDNIFKDAINQATAAGAAVYGRTTYQLMEGYWPTVLKNPNSSELGKHHAQWVEDIHKIVFSTTLPEVTWNNTTLIKENAAAEMIKLKQQPGKPLLIFGSPRFTHSMMEHGLIDEYRLYLNPIVIGEGVPLFKNTKDHMKLALQETKTFEGGVTVLHYGVKR